jgi:hypothetical protein
MMKGKLADVFQQCKEKGVLLFLDDSYCSTNEYSEEVQEEGGMIGFLYAQGENPDRIMMDILEEGSAIAEWNFEAYDAKDTDKLGKIIASSFQDHGYIVEWKRGVEVISTLLDESDLPSTFFAEWCAKNRVVDSDDENRVDPDTEVVFTKSEGKQDAIFESSDEESDESEILTEDEDRPSGEV